MHQQVDILVTGAQGQLGQALQKISKNEDTIVFASAACFDITNLQQMALVFEKLTPKVIINTAAYTQVDLAEKEVDKAFAINYKGVKNLSNLCKKYHCALLHISTDYVFDGNQRTPYKETHLANPLTQYGKSKRAGELAIIESGLENYAIIRTAWLYSEFGHNFYKTMKKLATTRPEIKVVSDQQGCPTLATELAKALVEIASQINKKNAGIYHYCNTGETTWYEFAKAIFKKHQLDVALQAITTSQFPTAAQRPKYSVLDSSKIKKTFGLKIQNWQEALFSF